MLHAHVTYRAPLLSCPLSAVQVIPQSFTRTGNIAEEFELAEASVNVPPRIDGLSQIGILRQQKLVAVRDALPLSVRNVRGQLPQPANVVLGRRDGIHQLLHFQSARRDSVVETSVDDGQVALDHRAQFIRLLVHLLFGALGTHEEAVHADLLPLARLLGNHRAGRRYFLLGLLLLLRIVPHGTHGAIHQQFVDQPRVEEPRGHDINGAFFRLFLEVDERQIVHGLLDAGELFRAFVILGSVRGRRRGIAAHARPHRRFRPRALGPVVLLLVEPIQRAVFARGATRQLLVHLLLHLVVIIERPGRDEGYALFLRRLPLRLGGRHGIVLRLGRLLRPASRGRRVVRRVVRRAAAASGRCIVVPSSPSRHVVVVAAAALPSFVFFFVESQPRCQSGGRSALVETSLGGHGFLVHRLQYRSSGIGIAESSAVIVDGNGRPSFPRGRRPRSFIRWTFVEGISADTRGRGPSVRWCGRD
mmetsp:Transcript_7265/g.15809  ORF Transcript_7265/g.15809 Transcript_7265/m.15809 type:complete len:474 (+) Transcript_7265:2167-3588(+)